ncbi:hypothetical protein SAY86_015954 [Trapa natans]|uniref:Uncharacterized protein n=1 Tax=Trapa natans TaxID=22666 RepID=A0AAN7LKL3_TRANT|nr:hypothetical protein SAY86_015954 [Trapa natans]
MAKSKSKHFAILNGILLITLIFLCDDAHGRRLFNNNMVPERKVPAETIMTLGGGLSRSHHRIHSTRSMITIRDNASFQSTSRGHIPVLRRLVYATPDFRPTNPGHSPGAGHSVGPDDQNTSHP